MGALHPMPPMRDALVIAHQGQERGDRIQVARDRAHVDLITLVGEPFRQLSRGFAHRAIRYQPQHAQLARKDIAGLGLWHGQWP